MTDPADGDLVVTVELSTVDDTWEFGRSIAGVLRAGDVLVLTGPLGAGKTALTQGIAAGLGVPGAVTSPTFVIVRIHRGGRLPLVHIDAYRLAAAADTVAEVYDLDLDASIEESVTVAEWGESISDQLADSYLDVHIRRLEDESRVVDLLPHGGDWGPRLAEAGLSRSGPR
jgi:tRNA threonylcarbamoyladenosine biosynthesis protein TsaE